MAHNTAPYVLRGTNQRHAAQSWCGVIVGLAVIPILVVLVIIRFTFFRSTHAHQ